MASKYKTVECGKIPSVVQFAFSEFRCEVTLLYTCVVRTSGEAVLEERPANAATSRSYGGRHVRNACLFGV